MLSVLPLLLMVLYSYVLTDSPRIRRRSVWAPDVKGRQRPPPPGAAAAYAPAAASPQGEATQHRLRAASPRKRASIVPARAVQLSRRR